jgi:uncharacterized membrane protein YdjX (TVP38/TMEM64 family)
MSLSKKFVTRAIVGIFAIAAIVFGITQFGDRLTLVNLIAQEAALETLREQDLSRLALGIFVIYVTVTGLSIPGAALLSLVAGRFLGFGLGVLVVNFGVTLGATLAFLVSRFVIGDIIREKYRYQLAEINRKLAKEGPFYLFSVRLIPVIPFMVINPLMALTPIKVWTYWWVSQLGMLPGTLVFVYIGSQIPSLGELSEKGIPGILSPELIAAFIALAFFPFLVRKIISKIRLKEIKPQA